MFLEQP